MSTDMPAAPAPFAGLHLPQNREEFQQLIDRLFQRHLSAAQLLRGAGQISSSVPRGRT